MTAEIFITMIGIHFFLQLMYSRVAAFVIGTVLMFGTYYAAVS